METRKSYCEKNHLDPDRMFLLVLGEGGGLLPCPVGMTGYFTAITDTGLICENEKLGVKKEIPFAQFESAEFGIGSAQLWLQCRVDGHPLVFCSPRRYWKSPAGKLLLEKIGEHTEIRDGKAYQKYTGKLFLLYMLK